MGSVVELSRHASELRAWLDAIAGIARAVNQALPLRDLLDSIAEAVCSLMDYEFCAVLLPDAERNCLTIEGAHGLSATYLAAINRERPITLGAGPFGEGPTSRAFATQQPVAIGDIRDNATFVPWAGPAVQQGYRSLLCVPLVASSGALGVLNCYTRQLHCFSADETALVETIANQAAIAIEAAGLRTRERATIEHLERLNLALEEHKAMLERAEEIHRHLIQAALAGSGLQDLMDALVLLLRVNVLIEDASGAILAAGKRDEAPPITPRELFERDPGLEKIVREVDRDGRAIALPEAIGASPSERRYRWVAPIVIGAERVGRVWALDATAPPGPLELRALEHGAVVAAFELLKQRTAHEVEWRLSGDLLNDLLAEGHGDATSLSARAAQLGHDLSQPHELLLVRIDSPAVDRDGAGNGPPFAQLDRRLLLLAERLAGEAVEKILVTSRGDHVALLVPASTGSAGFSVLSLADAIRRETARALSGPTITAALGGVCLPLSELPATYRMARGILDLASRTGVHDRVIATDEFGVFRLLLQVESTEELVRFARGVLAPLQQHDRRRSSDLRRTLKVYLESGCRPGEAAGALVIHPNTLAYRLRRIQELTGLELHRPDALLKAQLAVLIQELVEPT